MNHLESISKNKVHYHLRKMTLRFALYYPEHERRSESSEYRATRKTIIDERNIGCWVCGVHDNRELHHFVIEWSMANAIDFKKLKKDHPEAAKYETLQKFVDSADNMRVLCAEHHRHKGYGIHMLDFPEWEVQAWLKDGYKYHGTYT